MLKSDRLVFWKMLPGLDYEEDPFQYDFKIVDLDVKNQQEQNKKIRCRFNLHKCLQKRHSKLENREMLWQTPLCGILSGFSLFA